MERLVKVRQGGAMPAHHMETAKEGGMDYNITSSDTIWVKDLTPHDGRRNSKCFVSDYKPDDAIGAKKYVAAQGDKCDIISLNEYSKWLTGGLAHGILHKVIHPENGPELVAFFMDGEFDPVRVTFDCDGFASIHADGCDWHLFSADILSKISTLCVKAKSVWSSDYDDEEDVWRA